MEASLALIKLNLTRARQVRRSALVVKPKQPCIRQVNPPGDGGVRLGEDFEPVHQVYLVDEPSSFEADAKATVAPCHASF